MEFGIIENIVDFKNMKEEWDSAILNSREENPFLLSDFILTWWRYYSSNKKLMIFLCRENQRIISGVPMYLARTLGRDFIRYIGGSAANVTHFLNINFNTDIIEGFLSILANKAWDIFVLERVLQSDLLVGYLEKNQKLVPRISHFVVEGGYNGIIDLSSGYDSILRDLPKRLKRYLKNSKLKTASIGELKLKKIDSDIEVAELFDQYKEMSIYSLGARNAVSVFKDETYANFFKELLVIFNKNHRLDAHRLVAGKNTLAISFAYRFGKSFKWILTAFNPDFQALRPGHLLIDALIQEAIKRGDPYFDMYYGGEVFYKQQWCNRMAPLKKVIIFRDNLANRSILHLENYLRSHKLLKQAVKKFRPSIQ